MAKLRRHIDSPMMRVTRRRSAVPHAAQKFEQLSGQGMEGNAFVAPGRAASASRYAAGIGIAS